MNCAQCQNPIEQDRIQWCQQKGVSCKYCKACSTARKAARQMQTVAPTQKTESVDWDKIALGKIAHGFLIEAYKLAKQSDKAGIEDELQKAAREAYSWAKIEISVQNRLSNDLKTDAK